MISTCFLSVLPRPIADSQFSFAHFILKQNQANTQRRVTIAHTLAAGLTAGIAADDTTEAFSTMPMMLCIQPKAMKKPDHPRQITKKRSLPNLPGTASH